MKKLCISKLISIEGGVTRAEYCGTLSMILANSVITNAAISAWETHCAAYY